MLAMRHGWGICLGWSSMSIELLMMVQTHRSTVSEGLGVHRW